MEGGRRGEEREREGGKERGKERWKKGGREGETFASDEGGSVALKERGIFSLPLPHEDDILSEMEGEEEERRRRRRRTMRRRRRGSGKEKGIPCK